MELEIGKFENYNSFSSVKDVGQYPRLRTAWVVTKGKTDKIVLGSSTGNLPPGFETTNLDEFSNSLFLGTIHLKKRLK